MIMTCAQAHATEVFGVSVDLLLPTAAGLIQLCAE